MPAAPAAPVGSWLRVLAWSRDQEAEWAHLGLFTDSGALAAVFKVRVVHQINYSSTPPLTAATAAAAGVAFVPADSAPGGGSVPVDDTAPAQGPDPAGRFGGTGTDADVGETADTESAVLVPDDPVPGQADISPEQGWM